MRMMCDADCGREPAAHPHAPSDLGKIFDGVHHLAKATGLPLEFWIARRHPAGDAKGLQS